MQDRFTERIRRGELNITTNPDTNPDDDGELARQFKHAFKGGYSKTGGWAWLTYPPTSRHYINPRILWLTWKPGKSYEDKGRELLLSATLQPVDSAFNLLRQRVSGLHRAAFRARPGRSYLGAYWDPAVVCAELWIVLLWRNYGLRIKSPTDTPPAKIMGLTTPKRNVPDLARHAWEFRSRGGTRCQNEQESAMVAPQQLGLTRVFADFSELPYLLLDLPPVPRYQKPEIPSLWYRPMMSPVNTDHIEEDDILKGEHIDDYMADDVWQLMRRLDLITPEGHLSSVARSMLARHRAADDYTALSETLATQIKSHYRGLLNLSIVELLQESARGLANGDSPWAGYSPGLLLIEIQYLIELAHFDAASAQQQPRPAGGTAR